jgi:hypothetical protein
MELPWLPVAPKTARIELGMLMVLVEDDYLIGKYEKIRQPVCCGCFDVNAALQVPLYLVLHCARPDGRLAVSLKAASVQRAKRS